MFHREPAHKTTKLRHGFFSSLGFYFHVQEGGYQPLNRIEQSESESKVEIERVEVVSLSSRS